MVKGERFLRAFKLKKFLTGEALNEATKKQLNPELNFVSI